MHEPHERMTELFRVMGDISRFRVVVCLLSGPRNVSEIVRELDMKQSLVSHHLKVLKQCGVITAERRGPFVWYSVAGPELNALLVAAEDVIKKAAPDPK